ncbi:O-antigen ligase family protein [Acidobacteria bacterium AH-259-D05]|nr:O-antigen ligase family protein [Acidobacteria bacterium AH-259-D05]
MVSAQRVVGVFLGVALLLGLFIYPGRDAQTYYRLFIIFLLPALIAALRLRALKEARFLALLLIGSFLLTQVILQPTVTGRGFVIASLGWLALSFALVLTGRQRKAARDLLLFLILAGGAEALYGLIQSLGQSGSLAQGTFTNRNHFAGLLNMTIPLALGGLFTHYFRFKERLRSEAYARAWIVLISLAFMGLGILLSLSRGGTLTLIATLVLTSILLTLKKQLRRGRKLSGAAAWILLFTTLGLGSWVGMEALLSRFGQRETTRVVVYRDSFNLIAGQPLLGIGPGMYQWRFRPYQSLDVEKWWDQAHNDYVQSAAEWGIPMAMFFWGFVVWRLWRSIRVFFDSRDAWRQGIGLGCAGAIFSILVHSFVDFNLQIPVNLMIFCMILGLAWGLDFKPAKSAKESTKDTKDPSPSAKERQ